MNAAIVTIGDEILIGQVIDTNSAWIGKTLNDHGVTIVTITSVKDTEKDIIAGLQFAAQEADLILITGGLGPTKDDLTKLALTTYFDDELVFNDQMYRDICVYFEKRGRDPKLAHKQQCFLPSKANLLNNKYGTAPGMHFTQSEKHYISMPGVPYEMKAIFTEGVLPIVKEISTQDHYRHRTIHTAGTGETVLSASFLDIQETLPEHLKIAFLPSLGKVRIRISGVSKDPAQLEADVNQVSSEIDSRVKKYVFGYDDTSIEQELGKTLIEKGMKMAVAESCSGGDIARRIVSNSGSSAYFEGGIVTYSYHLKTALLGVSPEILTKYGAVSQEVVESMLNGLLNKTGADVGISVSGIAGPGGGLPEKPVGTIWIAYGNSAKILTEKINIDKGRLKNIEYAGTYAMNKLRLFLLQQ